MNEITLSNDLNILTAEITGFKRLAGQSIFEIGYRLKHIKEHNLTHGQFESWLRSVNIEPSSARKMITIAEELTSNRSTLNDLGLSALYLIATLPEEERKNQINRLEQGDNLTVRELQLIKKKYSNALGRIAELEASEPQPKEIVKEVQVTPPDYQEAIKRARELKEQSEAYAERNAFLEQQLNQISEQRDKANKYDDIERAIEQGRGQLNEQQKEIASTKEVIAFLKKGNQFLANFGGIAYLDIQSILPKNAQLKVEVETFASQLKILLDDVNTILGQSRNEILEGEIL
ncbi:DUF3102 domain-containing protein [Streptococcus gordonii]|uniref:DUF3102 domain-containing protein n=1 Tax=Streptococcus gordonii TaxID=1302 RepID=UPI001EDCFAE1|nr:DUF3102 domain-containing protein [Streptococcus gordonii]MCG4823672.1 DUF3102 domain-containing protein [Streptococcus gordonii]MCG4847847.1 DUF3102 domain-containing protein [Streptococcus gordonii]MDE8687729.1 DUF3102 domain-containing protein [Streptococcus gordonii]